MTPQLVGHCSPNVTPHIIAAAILDCGGSPVEDRHAWLEAVERLPGRRDFHARTVAVARVLALNADERNLAAPGISNLLRVCHLSERQTYRVLRRLRESGLLGWVSTKTTVLKSGNWRATYALAMPEVSPRVTSPSQETSTAREDKPWGTSPAMRYARKLAQTWTNRQFMTAITYPPNEDRPYGAPNGKSTWRVLAWRVRQYMGPNGTFRGRIATMWAQPPRDSYRQVRLADEARVAQEMARPGAHERVALLVEASLAAANGDLNRHAELMSQAETLRHGTPPPQPLTLDVD